MALLAPTGGEGSGVVGGQRGALTTDPAGWREPLRGGIEAHPEFCANQPRFAGMCTVEVLADGLPALAPLCAWAGRGRAGEE